MARIRQSPLEAAGDLCADVPGEWPALVTAACQAGIVGLCRCRTPRGSNVWSPPDIRNGSLTPLPVASPGPLAAEPGCKVPADLGPFTGAVRARGCSVTITVGGDPIVPDRPQRMTRVSSSPTTSPARVSLERRSRAGAWLAPVPAAEGGHSGTVSTRRCCGPSARSTPAALQPAGAVSDGAARSARGRSCWAPTSPTWHLLHRHR